MDIDEIRRANVRLMESAAGSPSAAADLVGMSYSQYVNLRDGATDPRSGKQRGMRKVTAWRFEDAFKKPRGWLDQQHGEINVNVVRELPPPHYVHPNNIVRQIVAMLDATDEAGRGIALMAISQALEKYRPQKETAA